MFNNKLPSPRKSHVKNNLNEFIKVAYHAIYVLRKYEENVVPLCYELVIFPLLNTMGASVAM